MATPILSAAVAQTRPAANTASLLRRSAAVPRSSPAHIHKIILGHQIMKRFTLKSQVELTARKLRAPRLDILAYAGGVIEPAGYPGPVVIDLDGMTFAKDVPILADHRNDLDCLLGSGTATVANGQLTLSGVLSSSDRGKQLLAYAKDGIPLSASVGVDPKESTLVPSGQEITCNGRTITTERETYLVSRSSLSEVSVVAIGADAEAVTTITAKGSTMSADKKTYGEEQILEADRVDSIIMASRGYESEKLHEIRATAIRDGWDLDRFELEARRAERPDPRSFTARPASHAATPDLLPAIICSKINPAAGEEFFGAEAMTRADTFRQIPLMKAQEMITAAGEADTRSLGDAINDVAQRLVGRYFNETPATWRSFSSIKSLSNFREYKVVNLYSHGDMTELPSGGEVKHGSLSDYAKNLYISTYAKLIGVDRKDVINDDLSLIEQTPRILGMQSARLVADTVYGSLMDSIGTQWTAGKGNAITAALSVEGLDAAIQAMRNQRGQDNENLDIQPVTLVVPPALETTARSILNSLEVNRTGDNSPTGNPLKGSLKLEVEPRLENVDRFANASDTHWWLMAAPMNDAWFAGFLDGKQQPMLESWSPSDFSNKLTYQWRAVMDCGSAPGMDEASVYSDGTV